MLTDDGLASDSQFRFVIRDAETHETVWGLTEHARKVPCCKATATKTSSRHWPRLSPKCGELRGLRPRTPRRISLHFW